jgi:hypothetical protein
MNHAPEKYTVTRLFASSNFFLLSPGRVMSAYPEQAMKPSSYAPVVITELLNWVMARMTAAKPEIMKRQPNLLDQSDDLSDRPAKGITMSRCEAIQDGVRVKLPGVYA